MLRLPLPLPGLLHIEFSVARSSSTASFSDWSAARAEVSPCCRFPAAMSLPELIRPLIAWPSELLSFCEMKGLSRESW